MIIALVLAGGTGTRLGADIPKQYIEVCDKPIIIYCLEQLTKNRNIDAIQIVADSCWHEKILSWLSIHNVDRKFRGFSIPGENRQLSIFHGLEDIKQYSVDSDYVFIHDAARPLLSQKMIDACVLNLDGHDGVLPVLAMKDTVYMSDNGKTVTSLLNRNQIFAGQAPEVFSLGKYYEANEKLFPDKILEINGSTEPAIMAGMDIAMISGDEENFKITTSVDLERFREKIERTNE